MGPTKERDGCLSREACESLAASMFEEKERLLQEGQEWNGLSESDKSYWISLVRVVLFELHNLQKRTMEK